MVVVGSLQVYGWILLEADGESLEIHFSHLPILNGNKSLKTKAMIYKILGIESLGPCPAMPHMCFLPLKRGLPAKTSSLGPNETSSDIKSTL